MRGKRAVMTVEATAVRTRERVKTAANCQEERSGQVELEEEVSQAACRNSGSMVE